MLGTMTKTPAKPAPPAKKADPTKVDADNPFVMMSRMLGQIFNKSVGRLPAPLVIIFLVSLALAVLAGLALKAVQKPEVKLTPMERLLPLRLALDEDAKPINQAALVGVWVSPKGQISMTIRFTDQGLFEWLIQPPNSMYLRQYIRGSYRVEGDVLVLGQRPDLGKPEPLREEIMDYLSLNVRNLNAKVEMTPKLMVWQIPEVELTRHQGHNPVFAGYLKPAGDKPMTWVKAY